MFTWRQVYINISAAGMVILENVILTDSTRILARGTAVAVLYWLGFLYGLFTFSKGKKE